jgi:hypothetical protein
MFVKAAGAKRLTSAALRLTTMKQFSRWSGIAHSLLSKHSPKISLGQVHQLLAACLGHRTYASLRDADLAILEDRPAYVLFDVEAGLRRSTDLDLALTADHWREATLALKPSGITPFWLTTMQGMHSAARLAFEDSGDDRIKAIKRELGFPDGHWATSSRNHFAEDEVPELLRFDVEGDIHAYTDDLPLALPVKVVVEFQRLGRRIYGKGTLVSVEKSGDARPSDREVALDGGDLYWMSED